ncbi:hypothetical protein Dimus_017466 [Dionaea muscipula]
MAKRGRPKRVVPGKTAASAKRGTESVVKRQENDGAGEILKESKEDLGFDAEIDAVIGAISDAGKNPAELVQPQRHPYLLAVQNGVVPEQQDAPPDHGHKSSDYRVGKGFGPKVVKPLGPKLGMNWTRKDSGAQVRIVPPQTTGMGGADGIKRDGISLGGNEGWQVVKHKSGVASRGYGMNQSSKLPVQNDSEEIGLGERDSLLVQCGHPMTSSASSSHDSRSLERQRAE